jgi:predicted lipid-binding transport protein (Tim44 family)
LGCNFLPGENGTTSRFHWLTTFVAVMTAVAEAWREGRTDYTTVAMRFALKDSMVERGSERIVEGGERSEVTEL